MEVKWVACRIAKLQWEEEWRPLQARAGTCCWPDCGSTRL